MQWIASQRGRDAVARVIAIRASARTNPASLAREALSRLVTAAGIGMLAPESTRSGKRGSNPCVSGPWGSGVEMKNVEILGSRQRAIARGAEALREKRARLIKAQAALEAAGQLRRASEIIMQNRAVSTPPHANDHRSRRPADRMTIIMMASEFVAMARGIREIVKR